MFYLEIWIRKGEQKFGCFKLNERFKDKIRFNNSTFLEKTIRNYYYCLRSLEYEKHNSRWTFAQQCEPSNSHSFGGLRDCRNRKYHFETSGQSLLVTEPVI